jgi:hypothetical protein
MREPENDFELVVSRLPETTIGSSGNDNGGKQPPTNGSPQRKRFLLAGILGTLVVILLLAGGVGQSDIAAFRARFAPIPSATISGADNTFYVVNSVPWGTLLANGHPIPQLSTPPKDPLLMSPTTTIVVLPRGHYSLEYRAVPYPTLHCRVSVPAATGDTCPIFGSILAPGDNGSRPSGIPQARVLDLRAAPQYLPTGLFGALEDATRQVLDSSTPPRTTLQPGERFMDAQGQTRVATEQLTVTARFTLFTDAGNPQNATNCTIICGGPIISTDFLSHGAASVPGVFTGGIAQVRMSYHYARMNGAVILANGAISAAPDQIFTLSIVYAWENGHWWVMLQTPNPQIDTCDLVLVGLGQPSDDTGTIQLHQSQQLPNWLDGCVVQVYTPETGIGHSVPLLYRFGVILAASPEAHQSLPALPQTDAYEQQLVAHALGG